MKRIIALCLCIVLLCAMLPTALAVFEIKSVSLSIAGPAVGEKPAYTAALTTKHCELDAGNNNPNYYKNGVGWYDVTDNFNVNTQSAFKSGHEYRVGLYLQPQEGFCFSDALIATVNGVQAEVEYFEDGGICVKYAFPRLPDANAFTDVRESDYFYSAVNWAAANSITAGTTPTTFSPDQSCTRAQVVTFLWRSAGCPEPETKDNPFKDVKAGQYYYEAVLWAVENGITAGTGEGEFSPEQGCTRAQVVSFLWRTAGYPEPKTTENPFKDVKAGQYYTKPVLWAVENGITAGTGEGKFSPDTTCTRAQIVAFLHRYSNLLSVLFQPMDYSMGSSQEDAIFGIVVKGGTAPYSYEWVVCYDNEEVRTPAVVTTETANIFTYNFSDYDFDDYRDIGVYCEITDSTGTLVRSKLGNVLPKG